MRTTRRVAIGMVMLGLACGTDSLVGPSSQLAILPLGVTLSVGDSARLVLTDGADTVPLFRVRWTSTDDNVVSVDRRGLVRAHTPGAAQVIATVGSHSTPADVGVEANWTELAVGAEAACARANDVAAWCWGSNVFGMFGGGVRTFSPAAPPVRAPALDSIGTMYAGRLVSCALKEGIARCWGLPDGSLGRGDSATGEPAPVLGDLRFQTLAPGNVFVCGLVTDASTWCWGSNFGGRLGVDSVEGCTRFACPFPQQVLSAPPFTRIASGNSHTCGTATEGSVWCWGDSFYGALGPGPSVATAARVVPGTPPEIVQLIGGWHFTCALTAGGTAWCWGANLVGELGRVTPATADPVPAPVDGGVAFASLATNLYGDHTCGLTSNGTAWCWGRNTHGQLGDGSLDDAYAPVPVATNQRFRVLGLGELFTCGIDLSDSLWCWGSNALATLGRPSPFRSLTPVAVSAPLP